MAGCFTWVFAGLLVGCNAIALEQEAKEVESELHVHVAVINRGDQCQRKTKLGDWVTIHYAGYFLNGTKFYDRFEKDESLQFKLGLGQVVEGLEQGLLGMCPGEKRRLTVPPALAYGDKGKDMIPPGTTLMFEVELIDTAEHVAPVPPIKFEDMDADGNGLLTREEVSNYMRETAKKMGQDIDTDSEEHRMHVQTIFEHGDRNEDGVISHEEFRRLNQ